MLRQKLKRFLQDESSGEIMLESTMIMLFTIIILIAMISLGFLFYQRIAVSLVANDIASEIAATYKLSNADEENQVAMYRTSFSMNTIEEKKRERSEELLDKKFPLVSLGMNTEAKVSDFDVVVDNIGRMHAEVTVSVESDVVFGGALRYLGIMDSKPQFDAVGRAECLDITAYAGHVKFFQYIGQKLDDSEFGKPIEDIMGIISDFKDILSIFGL